MLVYLEFLVLLVCTIPNCFVIELNFVDLADFIGRAMGLSVELQRKVPDFERILLSLMIALLKSEY